MDFWNVVLFAQKAVLKRHPGLHGIRVKQIENETQNIDGQEAFFGAAMLAGI